TICFDIFAVETLLPLTKGTRILMGGSDEQLNASAAARAIEEEKVTILQVTPSRLRLITDDAEAAVSLAILKYLLVCGEAFPPVLLDKTRELTAGKVNIFNLYGPTETTIFSSYKDVTGENTLNIGIPIANTRLFILSPSGSIQPLEVPGELCISGDGLSAGYLNRPQLTAEKFIANPAIDGGLLLYQSPKRVFKTGDLARWLPDGNIEFLGRMDFQVKIRGFRIELGETENQLLSHPNIKDAVVVDKEINRETYLCAYIVPGKDTQVDAILLREYLIQRMPDYMIPTFFVQLPEIPLTPNGKVDRKALPAPDSSAGDNYAAPRTQTEKTLVQIMEMLLNKKEGNIGIDSTFFELGGHSL
ncbi:MAG: amino acid adenylation domain-containing protein, partial [bacterium]|nr:amino acid adenylation domain-containing protein [bacterium]